MAIKSSRFTMPSKLPSGWEKDITKLGALDIQISGHELAKHTTEPYASKLRAYGDAQRAGLTQSQWEAIQGASSLDQAKALAQQWGVKDETLESIYEGSHAGLPTGITISMTQAERDKEAQLAVAATCPGEAKHHEIRIFKVGVGGGKYIFVEEVSKKEAKAKAEKAGYDVTRVTWSPSYKESDAKATEPKVVTLRGDNIPKDWMELPWAERWPLGMHKEDGDWAVDVVDVGNNRILPKTWFDALPQDQQRTIASQGWDAMVDQFYVTVKDGETHDTLMFTKDDWTALDSKYRGIIEKQGYDAMLETAAADSTAFKTNNVELGDGKWISKDDFTNLQEFDVTYGTSYAKLAKSSGLDALQSALAKDTHIAPAKLDKYKSTDTKTGQTVYDLPSALKDGAITESQASGIFGKDATRDAVTASNMTKLLEQDSAFKRIVGTVGVSLFGAGGAYMPKFVYDNVDSPESQLYLKLLYEHDQEANAGLPLWKKVLGFGSASGVGIEPDTIWTIKGAVPNPRAGLYIPPPIGGTVAIGGIGASAVSWKDIARGLLRKPTTAVKEIKMAKTVPMSAQGLGERVGIWGGKLVRYFPKIGVKPTTSVAKGLKAGQIADFVETHGLAAGMNRFGPGVMQKVYGMRAWAGVVPAFRPTFALKTGVRAAMNIAYKAPKTGKLLSAKAGDILRAAEQGGLKYAQQLYGKPAVARTVGTQVRTIYVSIPPRPTKQLLDLARKLKMITRQEYERAIQGFTKMYGKTGTLMRRVSLPEDIGGHIIQLGKGNEVRMPWSVRPSNIISPEQYFAALVRTGLIKQIPDWKEIMQYWPEVTTWYRPTPEILRPLPEGPIIGDIQGRPEVQTGQWSGPLVQQLTKVKVGKEQFVNLIPYKLTQVTPSVTAPVRITTPLPEILPEIFPEVVKAPKPARRPKISPAVKPTPTPTKKPLPKPKATPRPTPKPSPRPSPKPSPRPTPQPLAKAMPQPTPTPTPSPQPQPSPLPTPQPRPTPTPIIPSTPTPIPIGGGVAKLSRLPRTRVDRGKGKVKRESPALAVLKQGLFWVSVFPPFRGKKPDLVYSRRKPPWGGVIAKGRHSPQHTLRSMGKVPELITIPMGVVTAKIKGGRHLTFSQSNGRRRGKVIKG